MALALASILIGCTGPNTSFSTLQFADESLPFPEHYETEAARVVRDRRADFGAVRLSEPQLTIGAKPTSPKRWYVCLQGVPQKGRRKRVTLAETLESALGHRTTPTTHYVVLFFSGPGRPHVAEGRGSPLCQNMEFRPLTAEAPIAP